MGLSFNNVNSTNFKNLYDTMTMRRKLSKNNLNALALVALCAPLMACGGDPFWLPQAHKISIQQGNLLSEKQVSRIEVGMSEAEVRALIGAPVSKSPFHTDRWDYAYTKGPSGYAIPARRITLTFDEGVVSNIESNSDTTTGVIPQRRRFWEILSPRG